MSAIPDSVNQLIEAFARLPGVGPKTASRLTYFLLRAQDDVSGKLAQALLDLKAKTRLCKICFNICEAEICPICSNPNRDAKLVAVVEEPLDVLAIERTGAFRGRYHVLHGVINPREGTFAEHLKIAELVLRVKTEEIQELVIATNPGMEGDATSAYIRDALMRAGHTVKLTRLARGLPTGADLEYIDADTVSRAMEGRQSL
jgi:recombination protein RecR